MQLGTRWPVGGQPPARLSQEWVSAIRDAEADGCASGSWTLTWLEGRPQIVHDSGLELVTGGRHGSDSDSAPDADSDVW